MRRDAAYKLAVVLVTAVLVALVLLRADLLPGGTPRASDDLPVLPVVDEQRARALGLPLDAPPPFDIVYRCWPGEEAVARLLPWLVDHERKGFHPLAISRPLPDQRITLPWPEHPQGSLVLATNELGLRDDRPTDLHWRGLRVLVLGDSQTYGLVHNHETFCHRLEQRLAAADPARRWQVLDAGVSGTGPFEQLGGLHALQHLRPDLVLAVFFTGNDFGDAVLWASYFLGETHKLPKPLARRYTAAYERWKARTTQGFRQALRFRARPGDDVLGLETAAACYLEMARLCRQRDVPFAVAVLPSKLDVEPGDDRETTSEILRALRLTEEDYAVSSRLGSSFAALLAEHGVPVVELLPSLAAASAAEGPFYWRADGHLNVAGHAHVAARLEPVVQQLLPPDRPARDRSRTPRGGPAATAARGRTQPLRSGTVAPSIWTELGGGTAGVAGEPRLRLSGTLAEHTPLRLDLVGAAPSAPAFVLVATGSRRQRFLGGTLHAFPFETCVPLATDERGELHLSIDFPGAPSGQGLWFQVVVLDATVVPFGAALSSGVKGRVP